MIFKRPSKLQDSLTRTRQSFFGRIAGLLAQSDITDETWEELEALLIGADVGVETTVELVEVLRARAASEHILHAERIQALLKEQLVALLRANAHPYLQGERRPLSIVLVVGVNGSGKTTSIAKLARYHQLRGDKVLLAAGDTFRAAAIEQLQIWAGRLGVDVISHQQDADPGAVLFDAVNAAQSRHADVLIADTAGRLHTKHNLMGELEKIGRVCGRVVPGAPHHVLLVLDATLGQNGLQQAREFQRALPITSLALTKLDGTARGGAVLAIADQLRLPISVVGVGEGLEDWEPFDPEAFARGLFE